MIVDPTQQTPEIRELKITLGQLETVTIDALAALFKADQDRFEKKRAIAKELFKVARMEARCIRDEIGQSLGAHS